MKNTCQTISEKYWFITIQKLVTKTNVTHTHIPTQNQTQFYDINQQDDCERTSSIKAKLVPVDVIWSVSPLENKIHNVQSSRILYLNKSKQFEPNTHKHTQ